MRYPRFNADSDRGGRVALRFNSTKRTAVAGALLLATLLAAAPFACSEPGGGSVASGSGGVSGILSVRFSPSVSHDFALKIARYTGGTLQAWDEFERTGEIAVPLHLVERYALLYHALPHTTLVDEAVAQAAEAQAQELADKGAALKENTLIIHLSRLDPLDIPAFAEVWGISIDIEKAIFRAYPAKLPPGASTEVYIRILPLSPFVGMVERNPVMSASP